MLFTKVKYRELSIELIPIALLSIVIYLTIERAKLVLDPQHWGLMLSNAKDFALGKQPYKEIYIQYGFLTTLIESIAYQINPSLKSLMVATSLAYTTGLWLIYKVTSQLSRNKCLGIIVLTICVLFHPIVIYPWSNYYAFPFLIGGLYLLLIKGKKPFYLLTAGLCFSLAAMSREGLFPALILIIVTYSISSLINVKNNSTQLKLKINELKLLVTGFLIGISTLFIYLLWTNNLNYWYKYSILLPKLYALHYFTDVSSLKVFNLLTNKVISSSIQLDIRWILVDIIICGNMFYIAFKLFRPYKTENNEKFLLISWSTLFLLISCLHLPEIFRFATASIIGLIPISITIARFKFANYLFGAIIGLLLFTLIKGNSGVYSETIPTLTTAEGESIVFSNIKSIEYFEGQLWPKEVETYYQLIANDLKKIKEMDCDIQYQYNQTNDAFLQVLSPFSQFQVAPFASLIYENGQVRDMLQELRPELDYVEKIKDSKDIIVFQDSLYPLKQKLDLSKFVLFDSYELPKKPKSGFVFFPYGKLNIFIPSQCLKK